MLPLIFNTENLNFLLIGYGEIGKRKYKQLVDGGVRVTVLTPEVIANDFMIQAYYDKKYLEGFTHVIAATNNIQVNNQIVVDCKIKNIAVSNVSDVKKSDFFIPSTIRKNQLTISVHTGGKAPGITKMIKEQLMTIFDASLDEKINLIEKLRASYKEQGLNKEIKALYTMTIEELRHKGAEDEN